MIFDLAGASDSTPDHDFHGPLTLRRTVSPLLTWCLRSHRLSSRLVVAALLGAAGRSAAGQAPPTIVSHTASVRSLHDAIRRTPAFGRVLVRAGIYREETIVVDRPLTIEADSGAVLDGSGQHTVLVIAADDVTVRGFTMRDTGPSQSEERSAIRVDGARRCRLERNRIESALFGIYLAKAADCVVANNRLRGRGTAQTASGNGIHVWSSERIEVAHNDVSGHRDGIYFEFVTGSRVHDNHVEGSARYGMHFMFSDDCAYTANVYRANNNGVAVMYSKRVEMTGNTFEHNWGSAAYGLLLKDISDSHITGNRFLANSVGLYLEDANRNLVTRNEFGSNGWALKVLANAQGNEFESNVFESNAFDVGTNSRSNFSTFRGNYWDRYRGYDLDRDGVGDVPHAPVRLFALVVEQSPPTLILLRSVLVDLLDMAERVMPSLTPDTLLDDRPLMRRDMALARAGGKPQ